MWQIDTLIKQLEVYKRLGYEYVDLTLGYVEPRRRCGLQRSVSNYDARLGDMEALKELKRRLEEE